MQDIGNLGGASASAYAINNSGQVVGNSELADGVSYHAFLWTSAEGITDLGTLGGNYRYAQAINNAEEVTGYSTLSDNTTIHAFLWTKGSGMQDLGLPSGCIMAYGINDAGTIVGFYARSGASDSRYGFVQASNGKAFQLGTLGKDFTVAASINAANQVVGYAGIAPNGEHGFLWTHANGIQDLNDLIPSGLGVVNGANAINRSGQIAFAGSSNTGEIFVGLLTPTQR